MTLDGPYFRPLASLWAEKEEIFLNDPSMGRSMHGGLIDAAILILDMSGFSSLVAQFKDEPQAAAFAARHFLNFVDSRDSAVGDRNLDQDTIQRTFYDKMIGDAVMLVVTGKRHDALRSALAIFDLVTSWGLYPCKAGLHWGTVWLGELGFLSRPERPEAFRSVTVMGHVVNIAARLLAQAQQPLEVALLGEGLDGAPEPLDGIKPPAELVRQAPDLPAVLKGIADGRQVKIARLRQTGRLRILATMKPETHIRSYLERAGPPARLD